MNNEHLTKYYILTLSLIEGFSVMACELLSAKYTAPYFGSSLYVWSAVLGITLTALMAGYYFGGWLSEKITNQKKVMLAILSLGGAFLILMPYSAPMIMKACIEMSVLQGVVISLIAFLFPPLFLFGTTSPLLIELLNKEIHKAGKSSGTIYAVSTFGGIIATFSLGFYFIPEFGLTSPSIFIGAILIISTTIGLLKIKEKIIPIVNVIIIILAFSISASANKNTDTGEYNLIYSSEGILGQIKIIEQPFTTYTRGTYSGRILFVNNTAQTIAFTENPSQTLWDWSFFYSGISSLAKPNGDVLLLGLGGGTFYHQLRDLGYNVDAVELDQRIKDVAIEYFAVPESANVVVDDARHFININKKQYDLVLMDLFLNETPPVHALSKEAFQKVKTDLSEDGFVMINFYGFLSGENGKAARSIVKTLSSCGFHTYLFPTPGKEEGRNLIIIGGKKELDFTKINPERMGISGYNIDQNIITLSEAELSDAEILTDNRPILEKLYLNLSLNWRKDITEYFTKNLIKHNL